MLSQAPCNVPLSTILCANFTQSEGSILLSIPHSWAIMSLCPQSLGERGVRLDPGPRLLFGEGHQQGDETGPGGCGLPALLAHCPQEPQGTSCSTSASSGPMQHCMEKACRDLKKNKKTAMNDQMMIYEQTTQADLIRYFSK